MKNLIFLSILIILFCCKQVENSNPETTLAADNDTIQHIHPQKHIEVKGLNGCVPNEDLNLKDGQFQHKKLTLDGKEVAAILLDTLWMHPDTSKPLKKYTPGLLVTTPEIVTAWNLILKNTPADACPGTAHYSIGICDTKVDSITDGGIKKYYIKVGGLMCKETQFHATVAGSDCKPKKN